MINCETCGTKLIEGKEDDWTWIYWCEKCDEFYEVNKPGSTQSRKDPRVWNDPAKGQVLHDHQKEALWTGRFIVNARQDIPFLLDEIERLSRSQKVPTSE